MATALAAGGEKRGLYPKPRSGPPGDDSLPPDAAPRAYRRTKPFG